MKNIDVEARGGFDKIFKQEKEVRNFRFTHETPKKEVVSTDVYEISTDDNDETLTIADDERTVKFLPSPETGANRDNIKVETPAEGRSSVRVNKSRTSVKDEPSVDSKVAVKPDAAAVSNHDDSKVR